MIRERKRMRMINYYLVLSFIGVKYLDCLTTIFAYRLLGAIEMNPIGGYNYFSLFIAPTLAVLVMIYACKTYPKSKAFTIVLGFIITAISVGACNNLCQIYQQIQL